MRSADARRLAASFSYRLHRARRIPYLNDREHFSSAAKTTLTRSQPLRGRISAVYGARPPGMRLVEVALNGHLRARFFLHVCRETAQASESGNKTRQDQELLYERRTDDLAIV